MDFEDENNVTELFNCLDFANYNRLVPNKRHNLTFMHVNIRSLIKNFSKIEQIINIAGSSVDILVLTEVNISDNIKSLFNLPGYTMYTELRRVKKGGGIIVYIKNKYKFKQSKVTTLHFECLLGTITFTNYSISLCAVYRPPKNNKQHFIVEIEKIFHRSTNTDLIFIGDININLKLDNPIKKSYLDIMSGFGLSCGITDYTRIEMLNGLVTKSCIDHIFVRSRMIDVHTAALCTVLADHRVTVATLANDSIVRDAPIYVTRLNNDKLKSSLENVDWDSTLNMNCPNEIYTFINNKFNECYDESKYVKKYSNSKRNNNGWVNKNIINLCKKRDQLFSDWIKDTGNKGLRIKYNKIRNKTNKVIQKNRNKQIRAEINKNRHDTRKLWQIINNISGKVTKSIDNIIIKAFSEDKLLQNLANNFANKFQENVKSIIPNCQNNLLNTNDYTRSIDKSMFFPKATNSEIHKIIKRHINPQKAPGVDGIRAVDIVKLSDRIVGAITRFINTSIETGLYPKKLKTGIVRPIHKGGSTHDYDKYRPITILPVLDKVVEKFICGKLQKFYSENSILSSQQYGFQPNKSTTLLLSHFTDEINNYLNEKKHILIVFIDYSKAFDTLRHDLLIERLGISGVRGKLLKWCKNYLDDRSYQVKIGDMLSEEVKVTEGTAQGSVIGPLHYLTYVNNLNHVIKHCTVYQFADDTCLVAADKDPIVAQNRIQADFTAICRWSHDSGLVLNADKTKLMFVRSSRNNYLCSKPVKVVAHSHDCLHANLPCSSSCLEIEQVTEYSYLGLVIDNRFNWSKHIDKVCNKLRAILAKFYIIKCKVPFDILLTMYKTLVESIISYGLSSYGRTYKTYLEQIYNIQYRLLKLLVPLKIKIKYTEDPAGLFKYCGVLPISEKVKYNLLVENYFNEEIQVPINHKIATRKITNKELYIPISNNEYGKRTSQYLIPRLMNNLPIAIKDKINHNNIKRILKVYFQT